MIDHSSWTGTQFGIALDEDLFNEEEYSWLRHIEDEVDNSQVADEDWEIYDGFTRQSINISKVYLSNKSQNTRMLNIESYLYYCSVLKETPTTKLHVSPNLTDKERKAFHEEGCTILNYYTLIHESLYFLPNNRERKSNAVRICTTAVGLKCQKENTVGISPCRQGSTPDLSFRYP